MVDIILKFITDYPATGDVDESVRDFKKIANRYITKGDFYKDFITVFPAQAILLPGNYHKLFYLIKIVRLKRGIERLDIFKIMSFYKKIQH